VTVTIAATAPTHPLERQQVATPSYGRAHWYFLAALAAIGLVAGCDCASVWIRLGSPERTIGVGESFNAVIRFSGCGGTEPRSDVITWAADDPTVVRVDAVTGLTTGLRAGETLVQATGQQYGSVGSMRVIVLASQKPWR